MHRVRGSADERNIVMVGGEMSGTKGAASALTRRNFLKTTGLAVGATALAGGASLTALADDAAPTIDTEQIYQCVCRPNCQGYCRMNVHVRDGRIVKTSLAEFVDPNYNRICLRGLTHLQRVCNPNRVKYPLKRTGERGANEWERISWDEAIGESATNFKRIQDNYGSQAVAFCVGSGNVSSLNGCIPGMTGTLTAVLNATDVDHCVDAASTVGPNRVTGDFGMWVSNEPTDYKNAKVLFAWGTNITEAQSHEWHCIADAVDKGTI